MPTGGVLSISVDDVTGPVDGIVLTVQDNGAGIAADDLPKVCNAFFTTRATVGTGIGLFVAKQFVEGHGGHLEIESTTQADNHGTIVHVFLPVTTAYSPSSTAEHTLGVEASSMTL
jgi:signal transduction histidine kinase